MVDHGEEGHADAGDADPVGVTEHDRTPAGAEDDREATRRDVIVPLAIYKRVTVVSTVFASLLVVLGFLLLDAATKQTRLLRGPIEALLRWSPIAVSPGSLSVALGLAGLAVILAGAAVYVFGARFRTAEMGSDKPDAGEGDANG